MAKVKGVGQGLGQKEGTRVKGQWGGDGDLGQWGAMAWVKGGKGLSQGHGGILISPRNNLRGIL